MKFRQFKSILTPHFDEIQKDAKIQGVPLDKIASKYGVSRGCLSRFIRLSGIERKPIRNCEPKKIDIVKFSKMAVKDLHTCLQIQTRAKEFSKNPVSIRHCGARIHTKDGFNLVHVSAWSGQQ